MFVQIIESDLIRMRTREGMRMAKARGHLRGGTPKLNPRQEAHLSELYRSGEHSITELQDLFGVTRSTAYRAIRRTRQREQGAIAAELHRPATVQPPYRARHDASRAAGRTRASGRSRTTLPTSAAMIGSGGARRRSRRSRQHGTAPQSTQTRYVVCVWVGAPARKHGVPDEDMPHAVRNAMRLIKVDEDLTMFIGPARDASPLEIGVLDLDGEDPVIIHAMPLPPKFRRYLG